MRSNSGRIETFRQHDHHRRAENVKGNCMSLDGKRDGGWIIVKILCLQSVYLVYMPAKILVFIMTRRKIVGNSFKNHKENIKTVLRSRKQTFSLEKWVKILKNGRCEEEVTTTTQDYYLHVDWTGVQVLKTGEISDKIKYLSIDYNTSWQQGGVCWGFFPTLSWLHL